MAATAVVALLMLVVYAGRASAMSIHVSSAAAVAAEAAALRATPDAAAEAAEAAVSANLQDRGRGEVDCASVDVEVDTANWEPGGTVTVTVGCSVDFSTLAPVAPPGQRRFVAQATEALDLSRIYVPAGPVELAMVRGITVNVVIAAQLEAMLDAAAADGLGLTGGGYRSPEEQIALRRAHCGTSHYAIYQAPASSCSPPTARPGTSMHERGLAIDFEGCSSHATACWQWLAANAARYGFYNLPSETWHWSTDGS